MAAVKNVFKIVTFVFQEHLCDLCDLTLRNQAENSCNMCMSSGRLYREVMEV